MFRGCFWLCTQESLLAGLRGLYGILGIESRSAMCKAGAPPTPWPNSGISNATKKPHSPECQHKPRNHKLLM